MAFLRSHRYCRFALLMVLSWTVMTFTHEMGHIVGGLCGGGKLTSASVVPWRIPYSIFDPDPFPLVTLWSGLSFGAMMPVIAATVINRPSVWFVAHFCLLANGSYIAVAWLTGDSYLDTARLLAHGASPLSIAVYCMITIGWGYFGFRNSCIRELSLTVLER
ncbi:hypothetical protein SH449x_002003 [Pirellulaceae bacterium SH449]